MATSTVLTNKPINPRGDDNRPVDSYNRASLYSGKALDFDGVNDYVDLDGFTMSGNTGTFVFYHNQDTSANSDLVFDSNPARFGFGQSSTTGQFGILQTSWTNFGALPLDEWLHIALSINGTSATMYVNGQQFGDEQTIDYNFNLGSTTELKLMARYNAVGAQVDGGLSNFKIFNTALTAAQVADLYNNPEKIVPTGVSNDALKLWLPMMEGAGTTAYDGSGNGNHGTISGATYVNGVGSPVAQSAVIDWNKLYDFDGVDDKAYNASYQDTTGTKSYKVHFIAHDVNTEGQIFQIYNGVSLKGAGATIDFLGTNNGILGLRGFINGVSYGIQSWSIEANTYYELLVTINWDTDTIVSATLNGESPTGVISARIDTANAGLYLGARVGTYYLNGIINYFEVVGVDKWTNASGFKSESGSYDMTIDGSPTQILASQGLTTGRDITGVNLFENVRKQGALNLDGNSWAEVHDNASLDFGTGSFTLEVWARVKYVNQGSGVNVIMTLGNEVNSSNSAGLAAATGNTVQFWYTNSSSSSALSEGDWVHIVGVYDETNATIYVNGSQVDQDARTAVSKTNALVKQIGRDTTTFRYYNDQIAQPRIYNRALTASEVLNNYNATKAQYQ